MKEERIGKLKASLESLIEDYLGRHQQLPEAWYKGVH